MSGIIGKVYSSIKNCESEYTEEGYTYKCNRRLGHGGYHSGVKVDIQQTEYTNIHTRTEKFWGPVGLDEGNW